MKYTMNKLRQSRKGMLLLTFAIIGVIIGFITFVVITMGDAAEHEQSFIGENALSILKADQKAQLVLGYLDLAALFAVREGIFQLADRGGIVTNTDCGTYAGYSLWQTPLGEDLMVRRCVSEHVDEPLSALISSIIDLYARGMRVSNQHSQETYQLPLNNYQVNLRQDGGSLDVIGNARDDLYFQVRRDRVIAYTPMRLPDASVPAGVASPESTAPVLMQEETLPTPEPVSQTTAPECRSFGQGMQVYRGDDKIKCGRQNTALCCMQAPLVAQLERTKESLTHPEDYLYISAARSSNSQRQAFLDNLAGGAPGCGPASLANQVASIRSEAMAYVRSQGEDPARLSTTRRVEFAERWLQGEGNRYASTINDLRQYANCKHVRGYAIDLNLQSRTSWSAHTRAEQKTIRDFMCRAGWVNLGLEFWHYEYANERWQASRAEMPQGAQPFTEDQYHENCYFGPLQWEGSP